MANVPALRFTLGHAATTFHVIDGLIGHFHPDYPTPVGGPGENSLEQAKACASDPGCPVDLVKVTQAEADENRQRAQDHQIQAGKALRERRQFASAQHVDAETAAVVGGKE